MASTLPPDPYKALGVSKDAQLSEIRSAHRKLVLKCHPDKVQDAALKAIKQDEFQKVQQAYELLSDESRRTSYDEQVKLFELRKEMGRGNPTPRSNPFEYEIRTAEPRANSYARTKPSPQASPKVYSHTPRSGSYEDVIYEEPKSMPRKTASYEDQKRSSARDEERRRHEDIERLRQKLEKERKHEKHSKDKKSRDKEKRRGTEEKHTRTTYVQDESDDYPPPRSSEKKSSRHKSDEEMRAREEHARRERERAAIKEAPLASKWDAHKDFAGKYMQAARRKVVTTEEEFVHPGPLRRAETFTATYNVRHVDPQLSDDEAPRRSSARKESRRSSETPARPREKSSKGSRRSPPAQVRDAYIVEPPSPPPVPIATRKPTLQTHSSAPPNSAAFSSNTRERPSRSQTQDYPVKEAIPPLPRAHTFASGDRRGDRSRERGGSRLKKAVEYSSAESDSDSPAQPQRRSYSPPPRRAAPAAAPEPIRYIIDNGRSVPIPRHRSELRDLNEEPYPRERSESPRGGHRSKERSGGRTRTIPIRSQSQNYYTPDAPDPVIHTVRPKMPPREGSHRSTRGATGGYFEDIKFAPAYTPDKVIYSTSPADMFRRGSESRDHYYPTQRGGSDRRPEVYA